MSEDLVHKNKQPKVKPIGQDFIGTKMSKFQWRHPDPKLAHCISNMAICGFAPTVIAKTLGVDIRVLKTYYGELMEGAQAVAAAELMHTMMDMAITDRNEKIIPTLAKRLLPTDRKAPAEPEKTKESTKNVELDYSQLSREELNEYNKFLNKMKPPIEGEAKATE